MTDQANVTADANLSALFDFGFKKFITLSVIKILYILGLAFLVLATVIIWVMLIAAGFSQGVSQGLLALILGTIMCAFGLTIYVIFFRIWLELIVVIFRIGENTSKLVELGTKTGQISNPSSFPRHP